MASKPRPTIFERARERVCPECGGEAVRRSARGPAPTFCSPKCKRDHANRHLVEGRAVIALMKAWRIDRGTGEIAKESFREAVSILDGFNGQDRDLGRPRADLYAAKLLAPGYRYMDRKQQPRRVEEPADAE